MNVLSCRKCLIKDYCDTRLCLTLLEQAKMSLSPPRLLPCNIIDNAVHKHRMMDPQQSRTYIYKHLDICLFFCCLFFFIMARKTKRSPFLCHFTRVLTFITVYFLRTQMATISSHTLNAAQFLISPDLLLTYDFLLKVPSS